MASKSPPPDVRVADLLGFHLFENEVATDGLTAEQAAETWRSNANIRAQHTAAAAWLVRELAREGIGVRVTSTRLMTEASAQLVTRPASIAYTLTPDPDAPIVDVDEAATA